MTQTPREMPATVPRTVIDRVSIALGAITRWHEALERVRQTEALRQCHGRYEHEFRTGFMGTLMWQQVKQAHATLDLFEQVATAEEAAAVYACLGGKPDILPEGPDVHP